MVDALRTDVRAAWRGLSRSPGFAGLVMLTLAAGTGATSAAFSIVDAVLLRPPAGVRHADELVAVYGDDLRTPAPDFGSVAYPDFLDFSEQGDLLASLAAYARLPATVFAEGTARRVVVELATDGYFETLGIRPHLGRMLRPSDAAPAARDVGVISHRLWMEMFDGDPAAVGAGMVVNGRPLTIVGVAPAGFNGVLLDWYGGEVDVHVGMEQWTRSFLPIDLTRERRGWHMAVGRLREARDGGRLQAALDLRAARLAGAHPDTNRDRGVTVVPLQQARFWPGRRSETVRFLTVLLTGAGLVMLVACVNTAGLLLGRATLRARHALTRMALGAGRGAVVRQCLVESLLLFPGAAAGGIALAYAVPALLVSFPEAFGTTMHLEPRLDLRVLGVTVLSSLVAVAASGAAAGALATRSIGRLHLIGRAPQGASATPGSTGIRWLVTIQVSFSLVVVLAAVLFVRSLANLASLEPGFRTTDLLLVDLAAPLDSPSEEAETAALARYQSILERAAALPGIASAAFGPAPPSRSIRRMSVDLAGPRASALVREVRWEPVGPGYFRTLGVPLLRGREFRETERDRRIGAIVNESLATELWPGDPIGERVTLRGETEPRQIVGVVADLRQGGLQTAPEPYLYVPLQARPLDEVTLILRTRDDPMSHLESVRGVIRSHDPLLPIVRARTMEAHLRQHLSSPRLAAAAGGALGGVALLLAGGGLFGLLSLAVTRRLGEIGVRIALGATPRAIVRTISGEAARALVPGLALGGLTSLPALRGIGSWLYGVEYGDPIAWCAAMMLLAFVAVAACAVPVLRALALDPAAVLRSD